MKFNRVALLKATKDAIASALDAKVREYEAELASYEQAQAKWIAEVAPAWLEFFTEARKQIKKGQPLTREDLPGSPRSWSHPHTFDQSPPKPPSPTPPPELVSLREVLESLTDEEVSPTALRTVGITSAALRWAVEELGRAKAAGSPAALHVVK